MNQTKAIQQAISMTEDMLTAANIEDVEAVIKLDEKRKKILDSLTPIKKTDELPSLQKDYLVLQDLNNQLIDVSATMKNKITSNMKTLQSGKQATNAYSQNQY